MWLSEGGSAGRSIEQRTALELQQYKLLHPVSSGRLSQNRICPSKV
jgi:hypothetical protein